MKQKDIAGLNMHPPLYIPFLISTFLITIYQFIVNLKVDAGRL